MPDEFCSLDSSFGHVWLADRPRGKIYYTVKWLLIPFRTQYISERKLLLPDHVIAWQVLVSDVLRLRNRYSFLEPGMPVQDHCPEGD